MYVVDFDQYESSFLSSAEYDEDTSELTVYFRKYYTDKLTYIGVPLSYFSELCAKTTKSKGRFYLELIKSNFKLKKMADKPKTRNTASKDKRYIVMSVCVYNPEGKGQVKKDLMTTTENGKVYLNLKLHLLPDGTLDKYGNLGMITQEVPKEIWEKEKNLPADKKTSGDIVGNALEWNRVTVSGVEDATSASAGVPQDFADDLPF